MSAQNAPYDASGGLFPPGMGMSTRGGASRTNGGVECIGVNGRNRVPTGSIAGRVHRSFPRMRRTVVGFSLLLVLLGGCWGGVDAADPAEVAFAGDATELSSYRRERSAVPDIPVGGGLVVPPDRATASARVEVRAPDPGAAVERAHEVATYVRGLWSEDPQCSARVVDYSPVHAQGSESGASFSVTVSAQLGDRETTIARIQRVEGCLERFRSLATDSDLRGVQVSVGSMVATVDNPGRFRAQLLQERLEPLREVSGLEGIPEQFEATGVRCTSAGEVTILQRALGGVTLGVDFGCTRT